LVAEMDHVAGFPGRSRGAAKGRRVRGCPVLALELVDQGHRSPFVSGWDRTARASQSTRPRIPLTVLADTASAIIAPVRFTVTIEGAGWTDVQQLELPRRPREGELIETKYGTCRVTHSEATPDAGPVAGKIVCSIS
jgi:hypothetical protein